MRSLTLTCPCSIARSISRREPMPARASTFCNFSSVGLLTTGACGSAAEAVLVRAVDAGFWVDLPAGFSES